MPSIIRNLSGTRNSSGRKKITYKPRMAKHAAIAYPKYTNILEGSMVVRYRAWFNLNLNGIETQTATGPLFMMAGVNFHFMAASIAG